MDSELRFGVPPRSVRPIRAALRRLGANASTVEERYFDTGDGLLARAGVALRLRCVDRVWDQSFIAEAVVIHSLGDSCRTKRKVSVSEPALSSSIPWASASSRMARFSRRTTPTIRRVPLPFR